MPLPGMSSQLPVTTKEALAQIVPRTPFARQSGCGIRRPKTTGRLLSLAGPMSSVDATRLSVHSTISGLSISLSPPYIRTVSLPDYGDKPPMQ